MMKSTCIIALGTILTEFCKETRSSVARPDSLVTKDPHHWRLKIFLARSEDWLAENLLCSDSYTDREISFRAWDQLS